MEDTVQNIIRVNIETIEWCDFKMDESLLAPNPVPIFILIILRIHYAYFLFLIHSL